MEKKKRADVVLVSVENGFWPSYALPTLESFLSREGLKTEILYPAIVKDSIPSLVSRIVELRPKIVGMGGLFNDRFFVHRIVQSLASLRKDFKVVLGGLLVTPIPEFMLDKLGADIIVVGEGEITFTELVKKILANKDYNDIGGLVFKENGKIKNSGAGEYIKDLDSLPPLNYDKIPMDHFVNVYKFFEYSTRNNFITPQDRLGIILSSRGCPYKCNFCYHYGEFRLASVPHIIKQIKGLKERFDINLLSFADDLTLINKKRTLELCDAIMKESLNLRYTASAHLDCLDEEMVIALKDSGCVQIGLGLESGSQDVLNRMNKKTTIDQIKKGLDLLRKYKINWCGNIQIGQIDEAWDDVKKTRNLFYPYIDELSTLSVSITTPYPGTPLHYHGLKNGLIKDTEVLYRKIGDLRRLAVNFSKIPDWQIRFLRLKLTIEFDLRKLMKSKGIVSGSSHLLKLVFEMLFKEICKISKLFQHKNYDNQYR